MVATHDLERDRQAAHEASRDRQRGVAGGVGGDRQGAVVPEGLAEAELLDQVSSVDDGAHRPRRLEGDVGVGGADDEVDLVEGERHGSGGGSTEALDGAEGGQREVVDGGLGPERHLEAELVGTGGIAIAKIGEDHGGSDHRPLEPTLGE